MEILLGVFIVISILFGLGTWALFGAVFKDLEKFQKNVIEEFEKLTKELGGK